MVRTTEYPDSLMRLTMSSWCMWVMSTPFTAMMRSPMCSWPHLSAGLRSMIRPATDRGQLWLLLLHRQTEHFQRKTPEQTDPPTEYKNFRRTGSVALNPYTISSMVTSKIGHKWRWGGGGGNGGWVEWWWWVVGGEGGLKSQTVWFINTCEMILDIKMAG